MTGVRKRYDRWQIDFHVRGVRTYETLGPEVRTERKASAVRAARLAAIEAGTYQAKVAQTLGAFLDDFERIELAATGSEARRRAYTAAYVRWRPLLGDVRLTDLDTDRLAWARNSLLAAGLHPKTVHSYMQALTVALEWAVTRKVLIANPMRSVKKPSIPRREIRPFSQAEAQRIVAVLRREDSPYARYLHLLLLTGWRFGEWGGMRRCDVDLKRGVAQLRTALRYGKIEPVSNSKLKPRQVELQAEAVAVVKRQMEWAGELVRERFGLDEPGPASIERRREYETFLREGPLFVTESVVSPTVLRREWRRILKAAGVDYKRMHDLRHTFATLMLTGGAHPKVVQESLGHSKVGITLDTYSHLVPGAQRAAGEALVAMLDAEVEAR